MPTPHIPFELPAWADRYEFDERAALYEFYGKIPRPEAEKRALRDLIRDYKEEQANQKTLFPEEESNDLSKMLE